MAIANIPQAAIDLILKAEGLDQPGSFPGGDSGVTIGIGYDLGYTTVDQFESDWEAFLTHEQIVRLHKAIGVRGADAAKLAHQFADIKIKRADAEKVFLKRTLPREILKAEQAFPGIDALCANAQGALVSLIYNRGSSMLGERRSEMRAIRDAVPHKDLKKIAAQLRSMKRLWVGQGLDGLIKRREAEAKLVESCL